MPIMARTSGGIYKAVSDIYDTQGNAISKAYDTQGNIVFQKQRIETEKLYFRERGSSSYFTSTYVGESRSVANGSVANISSLAGLAPFCFNDTNKTVIDYNTYKNWRMKGNIWLYASQLGNAAITGAKIVLTNAPYNVNGSTAAGYDYITLYDLGTVQQTSKYVEFDILIPSISTSLSGYNIGVKYDLSRVYYQNTSGSMKSVGRRIMINYSDLDVYINLYK